MVSSNTMEKRTQKSQDRQSFRGAFEIVQAWVIEENTQ